MIIVWIEDNHEKLDSLIKPIEDEHEILPYGSLNDVNDDIETIASSDLILLDTILPTTRTFPAVDGDRLYSGVTVLERLLSEYNYSGKVIVLSTVLNPLVKAKFLALGVPEEYILTKPIRPSRLQEVILQALAEN